MIGVFNVYGFTAKVDENKRQVELVQKGSEQNDSNRNLVSQRSLKSRENLLPPQHPNLASKNNSNNTSMHFVKRPYLQSGNSLAAAQNSGRPNNNAMGGNNSTLDESANLMCDSHLVFNRQNNKENLALDSSSVDVDSRYLNQSKLQDSVIELNQVQEKGLGEGNIYEAK